MAKIDATTLFAAYRAFKPSTDKFLNNKLPQGCEGVRPVYESYWTINTQDMFYRISCLPTDMFTLTTPTEGCSVYDDCDCVGKCAPSHSSKNNLKIVDILKIVDELSIDDVTQIQIKNSRTNSNVDVKKLVAAYASLISDKVKGVEDEVRG